MIDRRMRPGRPRFALILGAAVLALLGVAFLPTFAQGAAQSFKSVVIRNTPSDPVPVQEVSPAAPTLRSGRLDVSGAGSEPIPAGVVLTDLVVWEMTENCEMRLHQGEDEGLRLAPIRDAADRVGAELHLETGVESTADRPLTLRSGGGEFCRFRISAFWSGYER
jgi:hypothetical protein